VPFATLDTVANWQTRITLPDTIYFTYEYPILYSGGASLRQAAEHNAQLPSRIFANISFDSWFGNTWHIGHREHSEALIYLMQKDLDNKLSITLNNYAFWIYRYMLKPQYASAEEADAAFLDFMAVWQKFKPKYQSKHGQTLNGMALQNASDGSPSLDQIPEVESPAQWYSKLTASKHALWFDPKTGMYEIRNK
jgi:hypothetical protein